jgi:hypothetical protein
MLFQLRKKLTGYQDIQDKEEEIRNTEISIPFHMPRLVFFIILRRNQQDIRMFRIRRRRSEIQKYQFHSKSRSMFCFYPEYPDIL